MTPKLRNAAVYIAFACLYAGALIAQQENRGAAYRPTVSTATDQVQSSTEELRPTWVDSGVMMETRSFLDLDLSGNYGRDTAVNTVSGLDSQFIGLQGHANLVLREPTSSLSLSHDATVVQFPGSDISRQLYQWTTVNFTHLASRRTAWGVNAANAYGSDAARASNSLSLATVNDSFGRDAVLAAVSSGNVLRQFANFTLDHQVSEDKAFTLGSNATFNNFLGSASSTRQFDVNGSFRKYIDRDALVGVRVDTTYQNYGPASCTTSSINGFTALRVTRTLKFEASAGPSLGPGVCTGHYQYEVGAITESSRGTRAYIGTSRKRGTGSLAGSLWETSAYGGIQYSKPRRLTASLSAGYTKYRGGTLVGANDVSGYFLSAEYYRPLTPYVAWAFTARRFERTSSSSSDIGRTVFFLTFTWGTQNRGRNAE